MKAFQGLGVAMITPFTENLEIDFTALQRLIEHMISGGVDYVVVQGTTGESATLSAVEKRKVLDFVLEVNNGRVPIVFGMGGNDTRAVCKCIESWDMRGIDGILSVSPYYNKPTQEGIVKHYEAVSSSTNLPLILYNVPSRTGSNVLAETTLEIAEKCNNVVAVKEASGDSAQIEYILQYKSDDFSVISGDDAATLPLISLGVSGVISVVGNAFPNEFSHLVHSALQGDYNIANVGQKKLARIYDLIFAEGNPAGIKSCLKHIGVCEDFVRLPLVPVSNQLSAKLLETITSNHLELEE